MPEQNNRVQPVNPLRFKPLETAARPVNTFVAPVRPPTTNPMMQLYEGLREARPQLDQFLERKRKDAEEQDTQRGQQSALENALEYGDAVKQGKIAPDESPWFVQGYKEQRGRVVARQDDLELRAAYSSWAGRDSDNPNDFTKFVSEFSRTKLSGIDDPYTRSGYMAEFQRSIHNLSEQHAAYTSKRVYDTFVKDVQTDVGAILDNEVENALRQRRPVNVAAINAKVQEANAKGRLLGVAGKDINASLVDLVTTKAEETGRPELLDILTQKRSDGQAGPGDTAEGRKEITRAKRSILSLQLQMESRAIAAQERARHEAQRAATREMIHSIFAPDGKPPTEVDFQRWEQADPDVRLNYNTIMNQRHAQARAGAREEDPLTISEIYVNLGKVQDPVGYIHEQVQSGRVHSEQTIMKLMDDANRAEKGAHILRNPLLASTQKFFEQMLDPMNFSRLDPVVSGTVRYAQTVYLRSMLEWREKNPGAGDLEIFEMSNTLMQRLLPNQTEILRSLSNPSGIATTPQGSPPQTAPKASPPTARGGPQSPQKAPQQPAPSTAGPQKNYANWQQEALFTAPEEFALEVERWKQNPSDHNNIVFQAIRQNGLQTKEAVEQFINTQRKLLGDKR